LIGNKLGQPGLLYRQEWSDLVAAGADDADDGSNDQQDDIPRQNEGQTGSRHQKRSQDQGAFPAKPVRGGGQPKGDQRVPDEGQREQ
jgi:hypothetical protein